MEAIKHPIRASNMFRAALCPVSPWKELLMPEGAILESDDANEGQMLHAAVPMMYAGKVYPGLNDEQIRTVKYCVDFIADILLETPPLEIRFECTGPVLDSDGNKIYDRPATADFVAIYPDLAIIDDWKMGRREPEVPAQFDHQLRCYVVQVRNSIIPRPKTVIAYRFHPRLWDDHRHSSVQYTGDDAYWRAVENSLKQIVAGSTKDAPANPGTRQCLYCKAKPICQEYKDWAFAAPVPVVNGELTPAKMADLLSLRPKLTLMNKAMKEVEEMARLYLADGGELVASDGTRYGLKDGSCPRRVDYHGAQKALQGILSIDAINACLRDDAVKVGDLEKVFRAAVGCKSKDAKEKLAEVLGHALSVSQNQSSIVEVKE
jgi:hypothetical protein